MTPPDRVTATPAALALLSEIVAEHGPVLFHQSGGCCDGSAPMCYPVGDYATGPQDLTLGRIGDATVFINAAQGALWAHTQLIIDVVPGRGGMFSLDNGRGRRFLTRSRMFTPEEIAALRAAGVHIPDGAAPIVCAPGLEGAE